MNPAGKSALVMNVTFAANVILVMKKLFGTNLLCTKWEKHDARSDNANIFVPFFSVFF